MIAWIIARLFGVKSLNALLRLRAEIRSLERDNKALREQLKSRSNAMRQIVRTAKENCDDILFY